MSESKRANIFDMPVRERRDDPPEEAASTSDAKPALVFDKAMPHVRLPDLDDGADRVQDINAPIPEGLPQPQQWRVLLMPVGHRKRSTGGLIVPLETMDVQEWTHQLYKVCAVGPFVYRGPAWHGFTAEELEAQRPKVGDLYLVDAKSPRRFKFKGVLYIVVNDDALWNKVEPEHVEGLQFGSGLTL